MTAYRAPRMHCGVYKAPPTGAKFPACRPLDAPHKPQEGDPGHQPPLHGFPWSYDGSYWANYWHLGGVPTRLPAGIRLRMPSASTRHTPPTSALQHTARITPATQVRDPARRHCPRCQKGNSGPHLSSSWMHAYASPRCVCPAPCVAWRCRAADYACCISMTTTASAAACLAQIPHAPMMQSAVSTWSTRPRTRMTGIAAAVVSRTPAISTANAPHAFNRICIGPTAWTCMHAASPPARARTGIHFAAQQQAKKVTFIGQVRSCLQQGHSNQGCFRPSRYAQTDFQVRIQASKTPRQAPTRSRHSNDFFACHAVASLPMSHCRGSIFSTDTGSPQAHPCHGAFETAGGLRGQ